MSKVQFYSCLKLIAAHQSAVPLRKELIASTIALPLPRFSWKESPVPLKTDMLNGNSLWRFFGSTYTWTFRMQVLWTFRDNNSIFSGHSSAE